MAATIRIKRTATSNRPATLKNAEMAFIEGSSILVIGTGTSGDNAASIIDIGGTGAFLGLSNSLTQTAAGTYTFSGSVTFSGTTAIGAATATTPSTSDDSTKVATTAYVKAQGYTSNTGTVTSVGLSLPAIFTVTGSPVTSSGTLTATLASQSANHVLAAPNGTSGTPAFRALAAADIPDLSATYLPVGGGTISSNLTISGNLTVNGTTTTINSTAVSVDDINIVLGDTASPTNSTADGGGITLKGTTDKTLTWVNSTAAWTSSEDFNLVTGKVYEINGTTVLSGSALGSGVTSSSLTSVGTLTSGALGTGFTAVAVAQGGTGLTAAVNGLVKGSGGAYSAAVAGTDYLSPDSTIDGGTYS
jgi:hypothetical protein